MAQSYKDLVAWQKAIDLVLYIYELTEKFPKQELYGLTSQLRRAAVSVPSNIAEISSPLLDALPKEEKNKAIFRLNMVACSCGCNLSIAACRRSNPQCATSYRMFSKITSEEGIKTGNAAREK